MHRVLHHRSIVTAVRMMVAFVVVASVVIAAPRASMAQETAESAAADSAAADAQPAAESSIYAPLVMNRKCVVNRAVTLYGVQIYGSTGFGTPYHQDLLDSGASWVRNVVSWSAVEPANTTPDKYNWAPVDLAVGVTAQECVNVVLTNDSNPSWASDYVEGRINKVPISEFAEFMGALAERYDGDGVNDAPGSPVVLHFEMYNEPDAGITGNTERWGLHGADYAAMLKAVYPAIKSASPKAQVLFGGLAFDFFLNPSDPVNSGPFIRSFLDDVLKNGGGAYFDLMNYHFYPLFAPNWVPNFPDEGPGLVEKTEAVRAIMRKYNVTKPVVITEMGWHNNPGFPYGSDIVQVRFVVQLYAQSIVAAVPMAAWWPLGDIGGAYQYNSGLVTNHTQGTPQRKSAYYAYQVVTRELNNASFVRELDFATDVKGYEFKDNARNRTIFIAWTNPTDPIKVWGSQTQPYEDTTRTTTVSLTASRVTIYDAFWQTLGVVSDGDDGRTDGKVRVTINGDPKYFVVG